MYYLACPYTSTDSSVMHNRWEQTAKAATYLADSLRKVVFSPILHWHNVAQHCNLPHTADYWYRQNAGMLRRADGLIILTLAGWTTSPGVAKERSMAEQMLIPIEFCHSTTYALTLHPTE